MLNKLFDLHMHSHYSDGKLSVVQLIEYMKARGVNALSITDHDTIEAKIEAQHIAAENGIDFFIGAEITTKWKNITIHVLGLNLLEDSKELLDLLDNNKAIRHARAIAIDKALAILGYTDALAYIEENFKPKVFGRLHFAQFLCDKKYAKGISDAFKKILTRKEMQESNTGKWPQLQDVIKAIHSAKGVAVLAHP